MDLDFLSKLTSKQQMIVKAVIGLVLIVLTMVAGAAYTEKCTQDRIAKSEKHILDSIAENVKQNATVRESVRVNVGKIDTVTNTIKTVVNRNIYIVDSVRADNKLIMKELEVVLVNNAFKKVEK